MIVTVHELVVDAPHMNALSSALMRKVRDELQRAAGRPLLITGTGAAFSAGLDLGEVARLDGAGAREFLELLDEMVYELYTYPGPVVGLVNGHAIAGGCVIALCCDERIAPDGSRAKIGLNEVALGVSFPPRVMALTRDRVPRRHHERVLLGAELFSVGQAVELGLLDEVVTDAPARARERLQLLASRPADAYAATKRRIREPGIHVSEAETRRWFREELPTWTSESVRERLRARLAHR